MITQSQIRELSDDIVRKFNPEKIILFGSYAYGTPTPDSDVDLLVILPYEGRSIAKATEIRSAIRARFPLDLLVYPAEYIAMRIENYDFFCVKSSAKAKFFMMLITQEWIDKPEGDFATASREMRVRNNPNYDSVCFHAQQCVEKYMKGRLQEELIPFPKTHDLDQILNLLLPIDPFWSTFQAHFSTLTSYAVPRNSRVCAPDVWPHMMGKIQ